MTANQLSSGDLLADRRSSYARMLAEGGDFAAAAEVQAQALERAPDWAAGWHELGCHREAAGDLVGAAEAWRKVLTLAESDIFGAGLKLALAGQATVPAVPPSEYVAQLFDDYSDRFDTALVEALGYSVPERLNAMIAEAAGDGARFARAVDLGCGTGLFGERIRAAVSWLEGYDLSEGMLAKAAGKGLYDHLARADIRYGLPVAPTAPDPADLVAAADVFAYFGDLAPVLDLCRNLTRESGLLAFSLEAGPEDCSWLLQTSLRYCHGEAHVRQLLDMHGFDVVSLRREPIRRDGSATITGLLVLARRRPTHMQVGLAAPEDPRPAGAGEAADPLPH